MNLSEEKKYINDFISNLSNEEFIEMLKECGHNVDIKYEDCINELFEIVTELDARNISSNSVHEKFHGVGWVELCDKGIKLFEQLK